MVRPPSLGGSRGGGTSGPRRPQDRALTGSGRGGSGVGPAGRHLHCPPNRDRVRPCKDRVGDKRRRRKKKTTTEKEGMGRVRKRSFYDTERGLPGRPAEALPLHRT